MIFYSHVNTRHRKQTKSSLSKVTVVHVKLSCISYVSNALGEVTLINVCYYIQVSWGGSKWERNYVQLLVLYPPPPEDSLCKASWYIWCSCSGVYLLLSLLSKRSCSSVAPLSTKSFVISCLLDLADSITEVLPDCLNGDVISEIERRRGHMRGRSKIMWGRKRKRERWRRNVGEKEGRRKMKWVRDTNKKGVTEGEGI